MKKYFLLLSVVGILFATSFPMTQVVATTLTPSIFVTSLNTPQSWSPGISYQMTWNSIGVPNVFIDVYKDGLYQQRIANNIVNTGVYSWSPTTIVAGSRYTFRVISSLNSAVYDTADGYFYSIPFVTVTSPSAVSVRAGKTQRIQWSINSGYFDKMQLILGTVVDGREVQLYDQVSMIGYLASTTSYFDWNIPSNILNTSSSSVSYIKVNVLKSDPAGYQIVASGKGQNFNILPPGTVNVLSPVGGETFRIADQITVRWTTNNYSGAYVNVILRPFNQSSSTPPNSGSQALIVPNTGSLLWQIQNITTGSYVLRVLCVPTTDCSITDSLPFTIGPLQVLTVTLNPSSDNFFQIRNGTSTIYDLRGKGFVRSLYPGARIEELLTFYTNPPSPLESPSATYYMMNWQNTGEEFYKVGSGTTRFSTTSLANYFIIRNNATTSQLFTVTSNLQFLGSFPKNYTPRPWDPVPITNPLIFSLVSTDQDKTGGYTFTSGNGPDWGFNATLNTASAKTISSMQISGGSETWSTSNGGYYAIAVFDGSTQLNSYYGQTFSLPTGSKTLTLYAQKWLQSFNHAYTLTVFFTDGTSLTSTVQPTNLATRISDYNVDQIANALQGIRMILESMRASLGR